MMINCHRSIFFGDLIQVELDLFCTQLPKFRILDRSNSNLNIIGLEFLPNHCLHASNRQLDCLLLPQIPAILLHFLLQIINRILLLHSTSHSLISIVVSSWINFIQRWSCLDIDTRHDGFNSEYSLHGFLGGNLVVICQS